MAEAAALDLPARHAPAAGAERHRRRRPGSMYRASALSCVGPLRSPTGPDAAQVAVPLQATLRCERATETEVEMSIASAEQTVIDSAPKQLLIGGEWRDASGGETLAVEDPSTGETLVRDRRRDARRRQGGARRRRRGAGRLGGDAAERALRDPPPRLRGAQRARRRAGAADDARDGQGGRRVEGRDHLRGRVLPLVRAARRCASTATTRSPATAPRGSW